MSSNPFDFADGDFEIDSLLSDGFLESEDDSRPNAELSRLARRISEQYVDVLAGYASQAFGGIPSTAMQSQVGSALDALDRLAKATEDDPLLERLTELRLLLPIATDRRRGTRRKFLKAMREWVLAFSELLEPAACERMQRLVSYDGRTVPLLDALAELRGIGPRRLERLYCAGLFTVEALINADVDEVAAVTGLPRELTQQVVLAAAEFDVDQRRRAATELRQRASEVREALSTLTRRGDHDDEVNQAVRLALKELQATLALLGDAAPAAPTDTPNTARS